MQNISLTKIANAIRRLESDNVRNESYANLVSQHESKLQNILSEIQKMKSSESDKMISELANTVNELKHRSINENDKAIDELQNQVQDLKNDLLKAINDNPVLTYEERSKEDLNDELSLDRQVTAPEFKALNIDEPKYSEYGSLDDVLQIKLGDTKISIDKDDNNREICSITNEVGGLAFRKQGSDDVWLLDRNKNSEMEFHFNSMDNIPLSINPHGVKMSNISLNGKTISGVANSINNETINDKTIPTVSAIVKYINANLQRMNLLNKLTDGNSTVVKSSLNDETYDQNAKQNMISVPHCNVSTISTDNGNSLLIENESNSFSLKDDEFNIISISASSTDGLKVGDKFKLNNNVGTLCKFNEDNGDLSVGRFVELTGSAVKIDDLIIPEVRLTNKLSTMVYGIIKSQLQNEFVKENKIYKLNDGSDFVTIIKKGLIEIPVEEGSFELGSLLVAGKSGIPTHNKNNIDAVRFCIDKKVPMVKVISKLDNNLVVEVV